MSATGPHTLEYHPKALKELTQLDKPAAHRILKAIDVLSVGPRPSCARPVVGYPDLGRIRVGGCRVVDTARTRNSWFSHGGSPKKALQPTTHAPAG